MPVILTVLARVKDWQAFQEVNQTLVTRARAINASHYQICRNANDASLALLLIELPELDDAAEMRQVLAEQLHLLPKVSLTDDRLWEPTGWQAIESFKEGDK